MTDLQGVVQLLCPITSPAMSPQSGPIQSTNVIVQLIGERLQLPSVPWPAVIVSCDGLSDQEGPDSDFENDNVIYPVNIIVLDMGRPNYQATRSDYQYYRSILKSKIRGLVNVPILQNTVEVSDVRLTDVEFFPKEIAELDCWKMSFIVACHAWEPRNRGGNGL